MTPQIDKMLVTHLQSLTELTGVNSSDRTLFNGTDIKKGIEQDPDIRVTTLGNVMIN